MPAKPGFYDYVKAAFNAKPWGMLIPPNWVMLSVFGLLGTFRHPGFFLMGAGAELAYLYAVSTSGRFRALVKGSALFRERTQKDAEWNDRLLKLLGQLPVEEKRRFFTLKEKCAATIEFYSSQASLDSSVIESHSMSLNKLLWIFLQLLSAKQNLSKLIDSSYSKNRQVTLLENEVEKIDQDLNRKELSSGIRKSLESKKDILKQRIQTLNDAQGKLEFIVAETGRIEEQVNLIREQALVNRDSSDITNKIDVVSSSLGDTAEWIKQQKSFFDTIEDTTDAPVLVGREKEKE